MIRKYGAAVLITLAVAFLAAGAVWENAKSAHRGAVIACDAVHDSNVATIKALRSALVTPGPNHDESEHFVDGLATTYDDVFASCLAKAP